MPTRSARFYGIPYAEAGAEGADAGHGEAAPAADGHAETAPAEGHGEAAPVADGHGEAAAAGGEHHYVFTGEPGQGALFFGPDNHVLDDAHAAPAWVKVSPFVAMLLGLGLSFWFYIVNPSLPARLAENQRPLYLFLKNKWYFDEIYDVVFVRPLIGLGRVFWKRGDGNVIDGFLNGVAMGVVPFFTRLAGTCPVGFHLHLCVLDGAGHRGPRHLDVDRRRSAVMDNLLSIVTFIPALAALILAVFLRGEDEAAQRNAKWVALFATGATFLVSLFILAGFDPADTGFQFVEEGEWLLGLQYKMGVDGISVLFVMLTTFIMPLTILASWNVTTRVKEYMIAFLILETLMLGVFMALDLVLFYLFFEAGLIPMFLIIGIWGGKRTGSMPVSSSSSTPSSARC